MRSSSFTHSISPAEEHILDTYLERLWQSGFKTGDPHEVADIEEPVDQARSEQNCLCPRVFLLPKVLEVDEEAQTVKSVADEGQKCVKHSMTFQLLSLTIDVALHACAHISLNRFNCGLFDVLDLHVLDYFMGLWQASHKDDDTED